MVYFKMNSLVIDLVRVTGMNLVQIACSRYCSRQVISYQSMDMIIKQLIYLRTQAAKQIAEYEKGEDDKAKPSAASPAIALTKITSYNTPVVDKKQRAEKEKEVREQAKLLSKFDWINGFEALQEKMEPVYMTTHVCNRARESFIKQVLEEEQKEIKEKEEKESKGKEDKDSKDEKSEKKSKVEEGDQKEDDGDKKKPTVKVDEKKLKQEQEKKRREEDIRLRMDIIEAHDNCLAENLRKINEKYKETDEEKEKREKEMAKTVEAIKLKQSRAEYQRLCSSSPGFGGVKSSFSFQKEMKSFRDSIKKNEGTTSDARFVLTYGIGFITLTFLGFLSGYFVGKFFFGYDVRDSLIVSIIIGTATLLLETVLLILRIFRMEQMATKKRAMSVNSDKPMNYPRSEADILAQITKSSGIDVREQAAKAKIKNVNLDPMGVWKGSNKVGDDAQSDATTSKSAKSKKDD